jgi:hypothetical protein
MRSRDRSCEPRVPIKSQTILAFDILRCDFCPRHNENLTYLYWCLTVVQSLQMEWTAADCYWSGQSPQSPQRRTYLVVLSSAIKELRDAAGNEVRLLLRSATRRTRRKSYRKVALNAARLRQASQPSERMDGLCLTKQNDDVKEKRREELYL